MYKAALKIFQLWCKFLGFYNYLCPIEGLHPKQRKRKHGLAIRKLKTEHDDNKQHPFGQFQREPLHGIRSEGPY